MGWETASLPYAVRNIAAIPKKTTKLIVFLIGPGIHNKTVMKAYHRPPNLQDMLVKASTGGKKGILSHFIFVHGNEMY